jgi:hypothetical protein
MFMLKFKCLHSAFCSWKVELISFLSAKEGWSWHMRSLTWSLRVQWWAQGDNRTIGISLKQFHWGHFAPYNGIPTLGPPNGASNDTPRLSSGTIQHALRTWTNTLNTWFRSKCSFLSQPCGWKLSALLSALPCGWSFTVRKTIQESKLWGLSFWYRKVTPDEVAWTCKYISDATIKMPARKIIFQQNLFQKTFWRLFWSSWPLNADNQK